MKLSTRSCVKRLNVLSPEVFLPLFVAAFYLVGLLLVEFSLKALLIIIIGIAVYLVAARLAGNYVGSAADQSLLSSNHFERLLIALLVIFPLDLILKGFFPVYIRGSLYLLLMVLIFTFLGKKNISLTGANYLGLGLIMILAYVVSSFVLYGFYGTYLNRTGGFMPAFLVGMGTITVVYGLMKVSSQLSAKRLFVMIGLISFIVGPIMAALIGYRAYAIFFIMPLVFQYYLERRPATDLKAGLKTLAVIIIIFLYTYFATSIARGAIYAFAPLDSNKAPAAVVESMKKGHYTDKDMVCSNPEARNKFITRPFFTYGVFLDVVDGSYPWGQSHGKLILSLAPGINLGRATTIDILKKPLSTSFFGLPFLEFGFAGVVFYAAIIGLCLAVTSRLKDQKTYALVLTIIMLWLDTGPSVWWHWLPFTSAIITFTAMLLKRQSTRNGLL